MKRITFFILLILLLQFKDCLSQAPTYELTARNFEVTSDTENQLEWDIYMSHTNFPTTFEYSGGQYYFNFNPDIANGGILTYSIVGSDLPQHMQPRNP